MCKTYLVALRFPRTVVEDNESDILIGPLIGTLIKFKSEAGSSDLPRLHSFYFYQSGFVRAQLVPVRFNAHAQSIGTNTKRGHSTHFRIRFIVIVLKNGL